MLTNYDWGVIAFYILFMFVLGFLFRGFSKSAKDYFRGGGSMMWWMVGASAFMTMFSAWTFTGAAGKAYNDGFIVAMIFFGNALGYFCNYLWASYRFRQMRIDTPIESVRGRFGKSNEQFFTWLQVPIGVLYAGIWLNALATFISPVFGLPLSSTIWIVGLVVVIMSVTGGSWAVVASDFIQALIIMTISCLLAFLTLSHPAIGGVSGLVEKAPSHFFNWTEVARPGIVIPWVAAAFLKQFISTNNMYDSYRYVCVKDSAGARKAALVAFSLMLIGPLIWFVPPMAAKIIESDLANVFPNVEKPAEVAYVFMGSVTLPQGMMGLLVCAIVAATMSSMNSGINRNAGIFVKSFYFPVLKPEAGQTHLLVVGKIVSTVFGGLIIAAAFFFKEMKDYGLFEIMLLFGSLIAVPYTIPLVLGWMVKKTPPWSGWSTVLVCFCVSYFVKYQLDPSWLGFEGELSKRENSDMVFFASVFGNAIIGSAWFFLTMLFYNKSSEKYRKKLDEFWTKMNTPVIDEADEDSISHGRQGKMLGRLCIVYGGFVFLLAGIIPNELIGRLCFVFCGGAMISVGLALVVSGKRAETAATDSNVSESTS